MDDIMDKDIDYDVEEKFCLTEWGCLACAFADFNVDLPEISGKMGAAIVQDFLEIMQTQGYISRTN